MDGPKSKYSNFSPEQNTKSQFIRKTQQNAANITQKMFHYLDKFCKQKFSIE